VQIGILSHRHFDHVHGDALFPNAKLYAGIEEKDVFDDFDLYQEYQGYDCWNEIMPGVKQEAYEKVIPLPDDVLAKPGYRLIKLVGTFHDRQIIDLGNYKLEALHLPGHTVGHYGFYLEQENILFSGDIDLARTGPWYSSNSADVGALIKSVQRIYDINPRLLVPSHRRIQNENIREKLKRYIQVVLDRQDKIYELLKDPMTIDQIAEYGLVFPGRKHIYEVFYEKMTIRNHLRHMVREGNVTECEPGIYVQV
jgi:glyoxylase-like metal-dependent hydrolase (beta-lactamase superfamily II)